MDYIREPGEIYAKSFAMIAAEVDLTGLPENNRRIAERLIHACGMPEILPDIRISPRLTEAVVTALGGGAPILADSEMLRSAIIARFLPEETEIICTLNDARAADIGRGEQITRSAAAVRLWEDRIDGAVVVIGNAPTALFHLLEKIDAGWPKPAAILAFPVGFVGAAESKEELVGDPRGIPHATLLGRRGGSAMAGAALNAISNAQDWGAK